MLRPDASFHDGMPVDAAAVAANLDRYRDARESRRKSGLRPIATVETPDAATVVIHLSEPYAPLLSVLSDRAGLMLSPTAPARDGARIGENPVCSGPFRFTRRVAQDRIELTKFEQHWNAGGAGQSLSLRRPADPRPQSGSGEGAAGGGGSPRVAFTLKTANNPVDSQVPQIIQAMAAAGGFDNKVDLLEASAMVAATQRGDYDAAIGIWSGWADPDGNVAIWLACDGFLNWGKYRSEAVDAALAAAPATTDPAARRTLYREAAGHYLTDLPHLFLYHFRWFWGLRAGVQGFEPSPDGMIRFAGLRLSR